MISLDYYFLSLYKLELIFYHLNMLEQAGECACARVQNAWRNKTLATSSHKAVGRLARFLTDMAGTRCCVLFLVAGLLVSVSGQQCQSALQAVTNLTNSQTAASVVYQSLNGKHNRYHCCTYSEV